MNVAAVAVFAALAVAGILAAIHRSHAPWLNDNDRDERR